MKPVAACVVVDFFLEGDLLHDLGQGDGVEDDVLFRKGMLEDRVTGGTEDHQAPCPEVLCRFQVFRHELP